MHIVVNYPLIELQNSFINKILSFVVSRNSLPLGGRRNFINL